VGGLKLSFIKKYSRTHSKINLYLIISIHFVINVTWIAFIAKFKAIIVGVNLERDGIDTLQAFQQHLSKKRLVVIIRNNF
jgi:hypothetical protein